MIVRDSHNIILRLWDLTPNSKSCLSQVHKFRVWACMTIYVCGQNIDLHEHLPDMHSTTVFLPLFIEQQIIKFFVRPPVAPLAS